MTRGRGINKRSHRWTPAEIAIVRRDYPDQTAAQVAATLGRKLHQVHAIANRLGVKKSAEFLASPASGRTRPGSTVGISGRFPKGHVPANKGLRRPGWHRGRMKETQFKKGQRPRNWRPVGTRRVCVDGYLWEKVKPHAAYQWDRWRPVHELVWKRAGRKVPRRHVIVFKDGDKTNVTLANLECISRAELARRNSTWRRYPRALAEVIQLRGAVRRKINQRLGRRQRKTYEYRKTSRATLRDARRPARQGKPARHRAREGDLHGR